MLQVNLHLLWLLQNVMTALQSILFCQLIQCSWYTNETSFLDVNNNSFLGLFTCIVGILKKRVPQRLVGM